ncbi:MAG TPA: metallophosphoesterase family protein [Candidatus Omnitrophota bacterium]|nr:metallophosphoesterase family protein [Candidatus Omnitrophota bacterium]HPT07639.1 metallophosphoesterase family protein [Candidatus Omnitrophota bacterium]
MRIGVISDTHIPDRAKEIPQKALEAFKNVDMIIHVGDLVEMSVLKQLKSVCAHVRAVAGNMDPAEIKNKLPERDVFKVLGHTIAVVHGWGAPGKIQEVIAAALKEANPEVIIFGHSHTPCNETHDGILFFNPGSPTDNLFAPYLSVGILEINDTISGTIIKV